MGFVLVNRNKITFIYNPLASPMLLYQLAPAKHKAHVGYRNMHPCPFFQTNRLSVWAIKKRNFDRPLGFVKRRAQRRSVFRRVEKGRFMIHPVILPLSKPSVRFGQKPHDAIRYQRILEYAIYERLGKKHFAQIAFEDSLPAKSLETDRGIGSMANGGGTRFMRALKGWGFNSWQQGPAGLQGYTPYDSSRFALNPLFILLKPLADAKWGCLLTEADLSQVVDEQSLHAPDKIDRGFVYHSQMALLEKAYQTYKTKLENPTIYTEDKKAIQKIEKAFQEFVRLNKSANPKILAPLERNALFSAMAADYQGDMNPANWSEADQNLFKVAVLNDDNLKRVKELKTTHADTYTGDLFTQYLAETFRVKGLKQAKHIGIKVFGDLSSVISSRDEWAYKHVFLENIRLGTPEDIFSETGQPFNGAVLNPNLIGEPNAKKGTLGPAGEWLKQVILRALHLSPDGIRVDHAQGWADPWVYLTGHTPHSQDGGARLLSTPGNGLTETGPLKAFKGLLARLSIPTPGQIKPHTAPPDENRVMNLTPDQVAQYGKPYAILMDILTQKGLSTTAIVSEDLGAITDPMNQVMDHFDLPRMRVTLYRDGDDSKYHFNQFAKHDWAMFGTHDMETVWEAAEQDIAAIQNQTEAKPKAEQRIEQLGTFLFPLKTPVDNKAREAFTKKAKTDVSTRVHGEMAALFASRAENIQITMSDYFGLRRLNNPGKPGDPNNFTLRLTPDFEENYYEAVKNHQAVNMPKVILMALHARGLDSAQSGLKIALEGFEKELNT